MIFDRRFLPALLVLAASTVGGTARADSPDEAGWYVGASTGRTEMTYLSGWTRDSSGEAFHGGYRFNRNVALEVGYYDVGSRRYSVDCPSEYFCLIERYPYDVYQEFSHANIAAMGILPLGERFEVFAKVGLSRSYYRDTVRFPVPPVSKYSKNADKPVVGLGARVHVSRSLSLRLQWDRIEIWDIDFDGYWLGMEYRFGR